MSDDRTTTLLGHDRNGLAIFSDSMPIPGRFGSHIYRMTPESAAWWHGDDYALTMLNRAVGYPADSKTYETGRIYTEAEAELALRTGSPGREVQEASMTDDDRLTRADRMLMAERRALAAEGRLAPSMATAIQERYDDRNRSLRFDIDEQAQRYADALDGKPAAPDLPRQDPKPDKIPVLKDNVTKLEHTPPNVWKLEPTPWGMRYVLVSVMPASAEARRTIAETPKNDDLAASGVHLPRHALPDDASLRPTYRMAVREEPMHEAADDRLRHFIGRMSEAERNEFEARHRESIARDMQRADDTALRLSLQLGQGPKL